MTEASLFLFDDDDDMPVEEEPDLEKDIEDDEEDFCLTSGLPISFFLAPEEELLPPLLLLEPAGISDILPEDSCFLFFCFFSIRLLSSSERLRRMSRFLDEVEDDDPDEDGVIPPLPAGVPDPSAPPSGMISIPPAVFLLLVAAPDSDELLLPAEELDDDEDGMIGVIETDGLMSVPNPDDERSCSFFSALILAPPPSWCRLEGGFELLVSISSGSTGSTLVGDTFVSALMTTSPTDDVVSSFSLLEEDEVLVLEEEDNVLCAADSPVADDDDDVLLLVLEASELNVAS